MNRFKKIILTLVVAMLGIGAANAELRFGIKAGVNVNHITNMAKDFDNNRAGWTAGFMTEFKVPLIGLCFDASLMYQHLNNDIDNKNFIDIPINIKYKFGLPVVGRFLAPYIFTGPDFAFQLKKNDYTKTFQTAWNIGLGLELLRHLQIGASYGLGMNNILKSSGAANNMNVKNNYWNITAAYLF